MGQTTPRSNEHWQLTHEALVIILCNIWSSKNNKFLSLNRLMLSWILSKMNGLGVRTLPNTANWLIGSCNFR